MTKELFLKKLTKELRALPVEEGEDALAYYSELLEEGEGDFIKTLPSPSAIARKLKKDLGEGKDWSLNETATLLLYEDEQKQKSSLGKQITLSLISTILWGLLLEGIVLYVDGVLNPITGFVLTTPFLLTFLGNYLTITALFLRQKNRDTGHCAIPFLR